MRSFASALIVAALATFSSAVPVSLPSVPTVSDVVREATPSIAVIFDGILTEIRPYTEKLTYLDADVTVTEVTTIVASIKAPIVKAIDELHALVGVDVSVLLAPVTGDVELTVAEVGAVVGGDLKLIFEASGHVIDIVDVEGGEIAVEVKAALVDLGITVTSLAEAVVHLVDGLAVSVAPILGSVDVVIFELGLVQLAAVLGIHA